MSPDGDRAWFHEERSNNYAGLKFEEETIMKDGGEGEREKMKGESNARLGQGVWRPPGRYIW